MTTENIVIKRKQGRPKDTSFPMFVTCRVTGKQFKINITQLRKQLTKNNQTVADYVSKFVSREGKHILEETNDTTVLNPAINPSLREEIHYEMNNKIDDNVTNVRKSLLKDLWNKIAQQPPEYYQEKFKIKVQNVNSH